MAGSFDARLPFLFVLIPVDWTFRVALFSALEGYVMLSVTTQVEWSHTWEELTEPPQANPNGLYIPLRNNKKVLGLFTSSESGKLVVIQSQEKCEVN